MSNLPAVPRSFAKFDEWISSSVNLTAFEPTVAEHEVADAVHAVVTASLNSVRMPPAWSLVPTPEGVPWLSCKVLS